MQQPILIFDSGVGGLSVLDEIRQQLPSQAYLYLFDNARMPYGELEDQQLIDGCVDLVTRIAKQSQACLVVIACNTASTLVLPHLRQALSIPVVGVVPAIKPAAQLSQRKKIALLATPGTIRRQYTQQLIEDFAQGCQVQLFSSSELVLLAEQKLAGQAVSQQQLAQLLAPLLDAEIDVLILGCTHFPILRAELQQLFGEQVHLVDSGAAIAKRVVSLLETPSDSSRCDLKNESSFQLQGFYTTKQLAIGLSSQLQQLGFETLTSLADKH